ncbi:hypothetical protein ERJ75_000021800 [Trypanosoma vivax]|nr:hypothetical protein ERJ75_000021800 [Trypanosoma vivax]
MDFQNAMALFGLPRGGGFTRALEATKECFQNEWLALGEGRPTLFRRCEAARSQIDEERQHTQATFAAADGESNGPKQRICQPEGQIERMVEHAQSLQETNGATAAGNGHLKAALGWVPSDGNARGERAKGRPQHPVSTAACGNGFFTRPRPANGARSRTRR